MARRSPKDSIPGLRQSAESLGDALDNGLCETTIGLYKTECVREGSPFRTGPIRTLTDLENSTSARAALVQPEQADNSRAAHPRKPRPSTTLDSTPESTPVTRNRVCTKPGMLQIDTPRPGRRISLPCHI